MRFRVRKDIAFKILGTALLILGVLFFVLDSAKSAQALFQNNEAFYAEVASIDEVQETAATTTAPAERVKVPILVYHIVRPSYPTDSEDVKGLAQTPEVFDAQMQHLKDVGYHVVSLTDLGNYYQYGAPLPTNPIAISFDDGWKDQFAYAFPILKKYHYPTTFFIFTNPIGRKGFMTWDNLREIHEAGMTIGAHTRSHPFLKQITDQKILWDEIYGSKKDIEIELGVMVTEFAYPFGRYDATTIEEVKKAGYRIARGDFERNTTNPTADQLYELGALNAPTTIAAFVRKFPGK